MDGHAVRSLSIVVIRVIAVHMASFRLDQALLAFHVAAAFHAFLIRFSGPPVAMRSAAVVSVGRRRSWVVAVGARVNVSVPPTMRGLAESAALLTPGRGLARPLRQRHCGSDSGVSVRGLRNSRRGLACDGEDITLTLRSPQSCTAVVFCKVSFFEEVVALPCD